MRISARSALLGSFSVALALSSSLSGSAQAADWYFYVQNDSSSRITRLEVKQKVGRWGSFNLGGGIAPGKKVRIEWAASTNDQDCKQSLRATFADGSVTDPTSFDFCNDLDTPIVFSDCTRAASMELLLCRC